MLDQATIAASAATLFSAHQNKASQQPLEAGKVAPISDAYRVQDELVKLWHDAGRGDIVGYKIALTSAAMQEMCGVNHPLGGVIFSSVVHTSPAELELATFQHVGVEFEVAVRLAADLPKTDTPHSQKSVASAVAACIPAYELIEDRHADYKNLDAFNLVADNCWNGAVVLGQPVTDWQALNLETAATRLWINEVASGEGKVGDAMGHPFAAVAWLANLLNEQGKQLSKGMIVMTGSSITTKFPTAGGQFRLAIDGMGQVELTLR